jgi:hypothetical protein
MSDNLVRKSKFILIVYLPDAAELDALDDWLQTMIKLSILEDREELARRFLLAKKRFETRVSFTGCVSFYLLQKGK